MSEDSETTPQLLRSVAARQPNREGVVDGEVRLTWAEVRSRSEEAARAFVGAGVEPGDRVAIWAPNMWEWVVAVLGLQAAGAVLVPVNTRYKGTEAAHILRRSRAKVLLTVEGFLGNNYVSMLRDAGGSEYLETIVTLRGDAPEGVLTCDAFVALGAGVDPAEVDARIAALGGDDLADLLFTSGTTGAPKGVMCTHSQTVRAFRTWAEVVGLEAEDRYLVVNPFFHAFGYKAGIVAAMTAGCTLVPEAVFDVDAVMATIERERITMLPGPPTLYQTILNHPAYDPARLGTLRLAVTGAASVPVELIRRMRDDLGFETVITGYGLTEACGIATMCRHDDDAETIASRCGCAIPGTEVRVVDEEGRPVPTGEQGEVVIRGYNVMTGYFEDPEQTAATIDPEGWLHTGDVGILDERGYLRITDRTKDMFIVGGFNAYPAEIENLLMDHGAFAQVAVVGVPDERLGEVGYAFAVLRSDLDDPPDAAEVVAWAREHMANFKVPRHVEFVDSVPVNPSGKVVKYELRDLARRRLAAS